MVGLGIYRDYRMGLWGNCDNRLMWPAGVGVDRGGLLATANPYTTSGHNNELVKVIGVVSEDVREPLDLGREGSIVAKPKEDDTRVGKF